MACKYHIQTAHRAAEEQVIFLRNAYHMSPEEIIATYTGQYIPSAHYGDAIATIEAFNMGFSG